MNRRITAICAEEQFDDLVNKFKLLNMLSINIEEGNTQFVLKEFDSGFAIYGYFKPTEGDCIISYEEMVIIFEMAYVVGLDIALNAHFPLTQSDPIL